MDQQTKTLLGKLLGEIYRIEKRTQSMPCPVDDSRVFGLVNGFETAIDEELESIGFVTGDQVDAVADALEPYFLSPEKLAHFKGFYDIEDELESRGVDRATALAIITYFNMRGQFSSVISKMDSSGSPTECRTFEPSEFDI